MITLLIWLLILVVVVVIIRHLVPLLGLGEPINTVVLLVVGLIALLILLNHIGLIGDFGGPGLRLR